MGPNTGKVKVAARKPRNLIENKSGREKGKKDEMVSRRNFKSKGRYIFLEAPRRGRHGRGTRHFCNPHSRFTS